MKKLSPAEIRVSELVLQGLSNKAIGEKLFTSDKTVKFHLSNIYKKTDARSRFEYMHNQNMLNIEREKIMTQELPKSSVVNNSFEKPDSETLSNVNSESLPRALANQLMLLIEKVNKDGVTAQTVNASCKAASEIHKILKLNFDMKKCGF